MARALTVRDLASRLDRDMKPLCLSALLALSVFALATPAAAQEDGASFTIAPYLWLPTVDAELRFNIPPGATGSPDISVGPVDYLENLSGALMLQGEARFNRFGMFTDFIYLDFSGEKGSVRSINGPGPIQIPIDVGTETDFTGVLWTLTGGYDAVHDENARLQAFGGFRYLSVEASAEIRLAGPLGAFPQAASVSRDAELWDAIVGVRGEARSGDWIFPYLLDVGAGSSELTWQASAGIGYRFGWGDVDLLYRHLEYEQDESDLIQNLSFSGPALAATFRF